MVGKRFVCDSCNQSYDTEADADECEQQSNGFEYPKGMIYGDHRPSEDMYRDITFGIAKVILDHHVRYSSSWACRDNGAGDNAPPTNDLCEGPNSNYPLVDGRSSLDLSAPHYRRMYEALVAAGITPTIWDGDKAIPAPKPGSTDA